jgi:formylglycine-generating enzyme required for sulfatase activity
MCFVPAGEFIMGSNDGNEVEQPQRKVYLDAYWMYKHDVTVAQYLKHCRETGRTMPTQPDWGWKEDHPMVNVSWEDAQAYADWAGVRLPTEAQWEKAARGTDGRQYPWGNTFDPSKAVCSVAPRREQSTAPVGSIPSDASPYGCLDMAGNVSEWCSDWYVSNYYLTAPNRNPPGPQSGDGYRCLRGGSRLGSLPDNFRCAARSVCYYPNSSDGYFGFRCARTD